MSKFELSQEEVERYKVVQEFVDKAQKILGHTLDGDLYEDGFCILDAQDAIEIEISVDDFVQAIKARPRYTAVDAKIKFPLEDENEPRPN